MRYDHKLVRESNKKRAETELKEAIEKVIDKSLKIILGGYKC